MALAVACLTLAAEPASSHETDHFTIPVGRKFADLGPYFSRWCYQAIDQGCEKLNDQIRRHMRSTQSKQGAAKHYDPSHVAWAVNSSFPWAMDVIEGLERKVTSKQAWRDYPGRVVGYKKMLGNALQNIHLPIDPRQFFRIWLGSNVKMYGHYLGSDKVGHFTDMGKNYFNEYQAAKAKGLNEAQCLSAALDVGRKGLIFSETGVLGYLSAGAYSNGDMISNYAGMLFYQNLTRPVKLKGEPRPPLLVRDGALWKPAPHVRPDSDFMKWFLSDHWDEALNPSHYESGMRKAVREAVHERSTGVLERYRDENGVRRSRRWFLDKTQSLTKYHGIDYAHRGTLEDRITLHGTCYADLPTTAGSDQRDHLGFNRLHQAAMNGKIGVVRQLIAAKWNVNEPIRSEEPFSSDWGNTPLHLAARDGRSEIIQALLGAGAKVNQANDAGATPLHYATRHDGATALLLQNGADVNALDCCGRTPLHWAAAYRADAVASRLLGAGASAKAQDNEGCTPMHRAARFGHVATIDLLATQGAPVNATDRLGRTPLHRAADRKQTAAVRALLTRGASVHAKDRFGLIPLHHAAKAGDAETVLALIGAGASPAATDRYGSTPLHLAARHGQMLTVQRLIEHGAEVDAANAFGSTPLHEVAVFGCPWTAKVLIDAGADPNRMDHKQRTPAKAARLTGHRETAAILAVK